MSEVEEAPRTYSGALLAAIAVAVLAAVGSLIWCFTLNTRLSAAQAELADAKQQNVKLEAELRETDARLNVATDELKTSLGLTQKQLDNRAQELQQREARDEATAARLAPLGIRTIADLRNKPLNWLEKHFGSEAKRYFELARGIDDRPVVPDREAKSIGHE